MLALVKGHRSLRRSLALRFLRGVWCILRDVQICHGWLVSALHKLAVRILRCHFDCDGFLRAARKHVLERAVTVFRDDSRARGEARAHGFHVAFVIAECVCRWKRGPVPIPIQHARASRELFAGDAVHQEKVCHLFQARQINVIAQAHDFAPGAAHVKASWSAAAVASGNQKRLRESER